MTAALRKRQIPLTTPRRLAMTDEEFLAAFLDARLTGADFNHQGLIRAAWLLLQRHPLPQAIDRTCSGIQQLATKLGAPQK